MDKKKLKKIGDRLRELRQSLGMTQQVIADKLNVSLRAYSDYERGIVVPPVEYLINIADFFGVSVDYLLSRTDFRTGNLGEHINGFIGLSDTTIKKLHGIHAFDKWILSHQYDEPHKAIDGINLIFEKNRQDILYSIFEYTNAHIIIPDSVTVFDDTGTGHILSAAALYRQTKLHDIIRTLDELSI